MKKSTAIVWLVIALALITLGLFYGLALGWDYAPSSSYETLLGVNASRVEEIRADMGAFGLRIYEGWDDRLEVDGSGLAVSRLNVSLSDGVLTITGQELPPLARFFHKNSYDDYAVIWLPDDFAGTVSLASESGNLTLSSFVSPGSSAVVTTDSGDVSVYGSTLESLRVTSASGDADVYDSAVGALEITTLSGDIWVSDLAVESAQIVSTSGDIFGSITAAGGADAVYISTATGYVNVER